VNISAIIASHESVRAIAKKRQLLGWLGHVRRATGPANTTHQAKVKK